MMVPLESVTALGIALTELISNSYRHAFPDHEGAITVTLARSDNASTATLTIQDNGVGFAPKAVTTRRGLGIVRRLLMQIGGTLDVCSVAARDGRWYSLCQPIGLAPHSPETEKGSSEAGIGMTGSPASVL